MVLPEDNARDEIEIGRDWVEAPFRYVMGFWGLCPITMTVATEGYRRDDRPFIRKDRSWDGE